MQHKLKVIISGGGTGGHIFPAVAIANALKKKLGEQVEILFIGALGRMEMEKVPNAGYKIIGLPIAGFQRKWQWSNLALPLKVTGSLAKAFNVINSFKPDVVIGVGGYASGPVLFISSMLGKPTLIQEQNSYAGVTNKILSKRAKKICVAYEGMEKFFPKKKLVITGNPIRKDLTRITVNRKEALDFFGLSTEKKTVLVIGGSLGSRTINESIKQHLNDIKHSDIQMIWQTGKGYFNTARQAAFDYKEKIKVFDFINRMDYAYMAADIVVSRAGALSISELCVVKKPAILVPSPNVAEDHQTKNAMSLVNKHAALLVKDVDARKTLVGTMISLVHDTEQQNLLKENIGKLASPDADEKIVEEILKLVDSKQKLNIVATF
jgi:UDP-N-acetylglucosamine--N-acetylmuramyl-(pentapeptide) pyrophosphoryl-undecaprenol N-acetylglucosamine transferase